MPRTFLCLAIVTLALAPAGRAAADAADDRAAAQQIAQDLKTSGKLRDYKVGVKYQDGVAWLMGTVTSQEQKLAAERIARQAKGVDRVISKLEIAGGSGGDDSVQQAGGVSDEDYAQAPAARPMPQQARRAGNNMPMPYARTMGGPVQPAAYGQMGAPAMGGAPMGGAPGQAVSYDSPQMPGYAWPSYASYPNYAAVTYPQQYSPTAWPYIGPFYPYPQVPLGWRKVTLEWDDGWWFLDFKDCKDCH
jgi:hypothetical protein